MKLSTIIFITVQHIIILLSDIKELQAFSHWFVSSRDWDDSSTCGQSRDTACASLEKVLEKAQYSDVIHIDGARGEATYELCHITHPRHGSLTLLGENGRPIIEPCSNQKQENKNFTQSEQARNDDFHKDYQNLSIQHKFTYESKEEEREFSSTSCTLIFSGIQFMNVRFEFSNCSIEFNNSVMINTTFTAVDYCSFIQLSVVNSAWMGEILNEDDEESHIEDEIREEQSVEESSNIVENTEENKDENNNIGEGTKNIAECNNIVMSIVNSQYKIMSVVIHAKVSAEIRVLNSEFSSSEDSGVLLKNGDDSRRNNKKKLEYMGGLHMTLSSKSADVLIENTEFSHQVYPGMIESVINLYEAALWIKSSDLGVTATRARVVIDRCRFVGNERALTLVGPFSELRVTNSEFIENQAAHAGGAVLVLTKNHSTLQIFNCTFTGNAAGWLRKNASKLTANGSIAIVGDEVHLDTHCCKGVVMLVGKGGAMRVQRGRVHISNSSFYDNRARLIGGSVFLDIDGQLTISGCNFENSPSSLHSLQGDIIHSDGRIDINNVKLKAVTATNGLSIFRHSGEHWSLAVTNVWVECPVGFDLRSSNSSAYGVHPTGLRRSYKVDQLSYFCESCPRNKYSLDFGYLNYTMTFHSTTYFTLLINGTVPKPEYTGSYDHHRIRCDDCPYGGQCVQQIAAIPNFWGYVDEETKSVRFQHCPKGYCCSTEPCSLIDQCADLRNGTLCGRCVSGYSEAWFSTKCVSDSKCGPTWLYVLFFSLGIFYAVFLMMQTDLKRFIFTNSCHIGTPMHDINNFSTFGFDDGKRRRCDSCGGGDRKMKGYRGMNYLRNSPETELVRLNPESPVESSRASLCNGRTGAELMLPSSRERSRSLSDDDQKPGYSCRQLPVITLLNYDRQSSGDNVRAYDYGCFITLAYYFQDALLLHISTAYDRNETRTEFFAKSTIAGLFKFELDVFELLHYTCAFPGMTPVPKLISQTLLIPYIMIIFLVIGIFSHVRRWLTRNNHNKYRSPGDQMIDIRLLSGILLALLFMYQKIGTTTFTLLNCVPLDSKRVLYVDGTITCYQYWQYGVLLYAVCCVAPFFLVLLVGPRLLSTGRITNLSFFSACVLPPPFLIVWLIRWIRRRINMSDNCSRLRAMSPGTRAVVRILQGPFRENFQGLCWTGILVGRRLILILLWTFVNDPLIRLLAMLLVCFIILLNHVDVQPYRDTAGNVAGTLAAAGLVTLGTINLVRAAFEAAEYDPTGPNQILMRVFEQMENGLIIWLPMVAVGCIALKFLFKLGVMIVNSLCPQVTARRSSSVNAGL